MNEHCQLLSHEYAVAVSLLQVGNNSRKQTNFKWSIPANELTQNENPQNGADQQILLRDGQMCRVWVNVVGNTESMCGDLVVLSPPVQVSVFANNQRTTQKNKKKGAGSDSCGRRNMLLHIIFSIVSPTRHIFLPSCCKVGLLIP